MSRTRKKKAVLVFGEDENDRQALKELLQALRPDDLPTVEKRRRPLVLVKGLDRARDRKNVTDMAKVVRADRVRLDVRLVVAHQDCDAVEPAHEHRAAAIENALAAENIPAVAATPAWEIETWWYLWPEAVAAVNTGWRRLHCPWKRVGLMENAKEQLRQDLRPASKNKPSRDYRESDGPKIAAKVRELGLIDTLHAISHSFERFRDHIRRATL